MTGCGNTTGRGTRVTGCGNTTGRGTRVTGCGNTTGRDTRVTGCGNTTGRGTRVTGCGNTTGRGTRVTGCGNTTGRETRRKRHLRQTHDVNFLLRFLSEGRLFLHYSRTPIIRALVIRICLALRVNLSRLIQNYHAFKLPVIRAGNVKCYGL